MVESAVVSASSTASLSFFFFFLLALNLSDWFCFNFHLFLLLLVFLFLLFLFSAFNVLDLNFLGCWFLIIVTLVNAPLLRYGHISRGLVLHQLTLTLILVKLGPLLGSSRDLGHGSSLKLPDSRLHLGPVLDTKVSVGFIAKSVHTRGKSSLSSKHTAHLSLQLGAGLPHQLCVVDETILGGVVLGLQGLEQSLLSSQDLDCAGWVLGQVHQAPGVGNESGPHQLPH